MSAADDEVSTPQLQIIAGGEFGKDEAVPVLVKVTMPKGTVRTPSDIVCVIDVSGSMGTEATIQSSSGTAERHGLSLLDVAKHGVRTVMKTLGPEDRLALVKFNDRSQIVFDLLAMDESGQQRASELLDQLSDGGGTNIWKGLEAGQEVLRAGNTTPSGRLGHVMLLTDGVTDDRDTCIPSLLSSIQRWGQIPGTISTFGFGYSIDSTLLTELAREGSGTYSFIPDAGFVGTVFVNTLSNLLVTMAREVYLELETLTPGDSIERIAGAARDTRTPGADGREVHRVTLGTLQYGQSKDTVVYVKAASEASGFRARLSFQTKDGHSHNNLQEGSLGAADAATVLPQVLRCDFVDTVQECMVLSKPPTEDNRAKAHDKMRALAARIAASPAAEDAFVKALLEDVNGQSSEAFSRLDWLTKWGHHYMPSIQFAHQVQQCNNFKDPSVQQYGGELFQSIQDLADTIFNSLPAPTPSVVNYADFGLSGPGGYAAPAPAAPQLHSMAAYNDRYGVCIDAASSVRLSSGEARCVGDLAKGDQVESWGGSGFAEVVCVVRTACRTGKALLCTLPGGARVTPYHPVYVDGKWQFPMEVASPEELSCVAVCSLVLRGAPAAVVEGVPCATLGHGIEEGAARHAYFGTEKVLEDLAGAPGFQSGVVEIEPANVVRDPDTGLVCRLSFN